jgi:hypothetical protein
VGCKADDCRFDPETADLSSASKTSDQRGWKVSQSLGWMDRLLQPVMARSQWKLLEVADFRSCVGLDDNALDTLGQGCPHISTLILIDCCNVTDQGLRYLGQVNFAVLSLSLISILQTTLIALIALIILITLITLSKGTVSQESGKFRPFIRAQCDGRRCSGNGSRL